MRIGELARHLDLNPGTIRYYEAIGVLPPSERTTSGYRVYDESDLERLTFIKTAQRLDLTLDEIREILAFRDRGQPPCGYVVDLLVRKAAELQDRIRDMQRLRRQLLDLSQQVRHLPDTSASYCQLIEHSQQPLGDS